MKLSQRLSLKAIPFPTSTPRGQISPPFQFVGGTLIGITDNKQNYIDKGYAINEMVYSVVNIILDKVRMPEWGVYRVVDEQALKEYSSLVRRKDLFGKDYLKALTLHKKAVEPIKGTTPLHELLKWPNETEAFSDFIANGCGAKMLTGDKFVWAELLKAGANAGIPYKLYNAPSQQMTIVATQKWPSMVLGYVLSMEQRNFTADEILHEKYWNPMYASGYSHLYGMSPIKAALMTVARSNSATNAGARAFENMGPPGVVYLDDIRLDGDTAEAQIAALKEKLFYEHMGEDHMGKQAYSGYKVGYTGIGLSPVDLNIVESQKWDLRAMCNIYGVPSQLLNDPDNKTYANQKEGEAALTARCAMPQLVSTRANFNRKLQTDWGLKGKNIIIDFDPNVFTELRQSAADVAAWTSQLIAITPNEQRTLMGMDALQDPIMDEVWVNSVGRQPMSEREANIVDNELNAGADTEDGIE